MTEEKERSCRVCGCTDKKACPGGCHWVGDDLCSECVDDTPEQPEEQPKGKLCPMMSRPYPVPGKFAGQIVFTISRVDCRKENCQMWTEVRSMENQIIPGCSLELAAHMNSAGHYRL